MIVEGAGRQSGIRLPLVEFARRKYTVARPTKFGVGDVLSAHLQRCPCILLTAILESERVRESSAGIASPTAFQQLQQHACRFRSCVDIE